MTAPQEPNPFESPAPQAGPSAAENTQPQRKVSSRGSMSRVLPTKCPECGEKFRVMLSMPRMQAKVALVLIGGAVGTVVWILVIIALFALASVIIIPIGPAAIALGGTTLVVPLIVAFAWARRIPRVSTLKCHKCRWSKSWFVEP